MSDVAESLAGWLNISDDARSGGTWEHRTWANEIEDLEDKVWGGVRGWKKRRGGRKG